MQISQFDVDVAGEQPHLAAPQLYIDVCFRHVNLCNGISMPRVPSGDAVPAEQISALCQMKEDGSVRFKF